MNPAPAIRKAVFPVAGLGTRFLPATKVVPKELLPVVDKPLIQYAVEESVAAGIDTLIFIVSPIKSGIAEHFERESAIQAELEAKGQSELVALLRDVIPDGVATVYVTQEKALGLGHAVLCAESAVGNEPFAVVLPDDMVLDPGRGALQQLVDLHRKTGASVIGVEPVPREATRRYGVVAVETDTAGHQRIREIVEKPEPKDAPSNLGVVGRYVLSADVFAHLRATERGVGGEIQLTDAIAALMRQSPVLACAFEGQRYDCGSPQGFLEATIDYALANEELRDGLLAHLSARLGSYR